MPSGNLEHWLNLATRRLAAESAVQVRTEIQAHYESAFEKALLDGATGDEAERAAVTALGDPKTANRLYRRVLLTAADARLLRQTRWEARAVCSRGWLRWIAVIPVAALTATSWLAWSGRSDLLLPLLLTTIGIGLLFAATSLPVYTPARSRVFRGVRWAWLLAVLTLPSWPHLAANIWLVLVVGWFEWRLIALRRKLPVSEWPKQLYL